MKHKATQLDSDLCHSLVSLFNVTLKCYSQLVSLSGATLKCHYLVSLSSVTLAVVSLSSVT